MLSKNMVFTLLEVSYRGNNTYESRDGRTVRALQNRALLRNVRYSKRDRVWRWKLTKTGVQVMRNLKFIDTSVLNQLVR